MVNEHMMNSIHISYARRDVLFYAVTASQRKITRHGAHMKIEGSIYIHKAVNRHVCVTAASQNVIIPCDRVPIQ